MYLLSNQAVFCLSMVNFTIRNKLLPSDGPPGSLVHKCWTESTTYDAQVLTPNSPKPADASDESEANHQRVKWANLTTPTIFSWDVSLSTFGDFGGFRWTNHPVSSNPSPPKKNTENKTTTPRNEFQDAMDSDTSKSLGRCYGNVSTTTWDPKKKRPGLGEVWSCVFFSWRFMFHTRKLHFELFTAFFFQC